MLDAVAQLFSTLLGLYFLWHAPVHTPPIECGTFQEIEYCDYGGDPASPRFLYMMNGAGHNATGWSRNPIQGKIEEIWRTQKLPRPHVVTIGKTHLWWYTEKIEGEKLNAFVDWFESRHSVKGTAERVLYGDSMGGHNVYRWAADFPDRFKAIAMSCPAMPLSFSKNPVHTGWWGFSSMADQVIRGHYAQASEKLNPIERLLSQPIHDFVPRVYIASATEDQLGFYSGAKALAEALKERTHSTVMFEEEVVTHCYIEPKNLAKFLVE